MPNLAKGNNVFRPSQGTYGAASSSLQQLDPNDSANLSDGIADAVDSPNPNDETTDPVDAREETPPPPSSEVSPTRVSPPSVIASTTTSSTNFAHPSATPSATSSSKRKQSALSSVQSTGASKKQRTNAGASAMDGIKESLDNFNSTVAKSILVHPERMRADSSPERREKAVRLLELQENYLSDDELIAFFDYFKNNTAAADIYLAITRESLRKGWVQRQLWKELGFPQALP
jgi:hypothetical protein